MLRARPLSELLAQTLSPTVEAAILFTHAGSLLAQASEPSDQRRSRVTAALSASIWATSDPSAKPNDSNEHDRQDDNLGVMRSGDDWICIDLENGKLFIKKIDINGNDFGMLSEGLFIGIQGTKKSQFGYLKLQATKIQTYLEEEFKKVAK